MDRDEFMELVYETFADEPDNVLANGIIEAADAYAENEKAQLSKKGTTFDMVSRQEALDALRRCQTYLYDARDPELKIELSSAEATINNLPTIQPEKAQLSQEGTTSDTISRQAAIDAINSWRGRFSEEYNEAIDDCENSIIELPPIQPEPKEGHWIWVVGDLECSKCHTRYPDLYPDYDNSVACPHCGARMKGEI